MSTGTAYEKSVRLTCEAYEQAGIAYLEKVAPPVHVSRRPAGPGKKPIVDVRLLENPFLDFVGTWEARGGKLLMLECKYTTDPLLSIGGDHGIKGKQLASAIRWERSGAAVAFLWRCAAGGQDTRLVTPNMVRAQLTRRKSLRWVDAHPVPQGKGFILIDFLSVLGRLHKTPTSTTPTNEQH